MVAINKLAFLAFGLLGIAADTEDIVLDDAPALNETQSSGNDTVNGIPSEVNGALGRAASSLSTAKTRIAQDHLNSTEDVLNNLASSVQNTNSALWQVSEACLIFCMPPAPPPVSCCGSCCTTTCGCYGTYSFRGVQYNLAVDGKPKVGNLFPEFLTGNMNYVKETLGDSLSPVMKQMTQTVNSLTKDVSSGKVDKAAIDEVNDVIPQVRLFLKNTQQISGVESERKALISALDKLSAAIKN
ncbi:hypothetical protein TRICI_005320 [Trichomonascus ciferrii]|uniref:Secreted protein n=1 Tax=Trichomonascus ciferrii TaxID=44093 RepID=A0A642UTV4_9ASCO|nr:hypothetical protein TRICI_005320 [Trichomonascus ciferrii]